jgi:L-rhamnose mutarotase
MDGHIKHELQQSMNLLDSELDVACMCFSDVMQDWWHKSNLYLKETNSLDNDPFWKTSLKIRTTNLTKILDQRKSELDSLSIKYKESAISYMKQLTELNKAVLIFAPGRSTTLTAAKIHQRLSTTKHVILTLQQLVLYKNEVMLAWKSMFDVLVLESQFSTENFQDVADEISEILNEFGVEKKFIFISDRDGNIHHINTLRVTLRKTLTEEYDDWKLTDLVTESKSSFLEKEVIFQGKESQIKNLVKENDFLMLNVLDCDTITLLLANQKPSIETSTEDKPHYYTGRTPETVTDNESACCVNNCFSDCCVDDCVSDCCVDDCVSDCCFCDCQCPVC